MTFLPEHLILSQLLDLFVLLRFKFLCIIMMPSPDLMQGQRLTDPGKRNLRGFHIPCVNDICFQQSV